MQHNGACAYIDGYCIVLQLERNISWTTWSDPIWTIQITCIYFNELPSCSLSSFSSFSSSFFVFVCPTITVFLMSFTSTIHYIVLLISNKNLPLKNPDIDDRKMKCSCLISSFNRLRCNYANVQPCILSKLFKSFFTSIVVQAYGIILQTVSEKNTMLWNIGVRKMID